jgi:citrate lyase subunit beta/citryl-CoA lyase
MTPLRSLLFVPGNKENMLEKSLAFAPDVVLPDMEDSVPDAKKGAARATVSKFLPRLLAGPSRVMPRVNSLETPWTEDDLAAVVVPGVFGISIGKIRSAADISTVSNMMAKLEARAGMEIGGLRMIPWLETTQAIVHCFDICSASARIVGVAFGGEDFTNDLGVERLEDENQLLFARSAFCIAARAANVLAFETPFFKFRDDDALRADSLAAKRLGFKGRFAIHPAQLETIEQCFRPSAAEVELARRVVAAYEAAEREGRGSTSLDGMVIDVPVVKRARGVLALADD